jgi:hypothetical protein
MPIRRKRRSGKVAGKTCGQVARFPLDKPLVNRWIGAGTKSLLARFLAQAHGTVDSVHTF